MPFITLSNLKRFLANLLSKNLVFTKSLSIATDLTKDENGSTRIGSYWIINGQIQAPLLIIGNYAGDHGVFYRGDEVVTKRNTYSKSETYTKKEVDNAIKNSQTDVSKWKEAYNALKVRSYPTQFDNDELTALTSKPMNLRGTAEISLSQPYTSFDGLLFEVTDGGEIEGEHFGLTHIYISTAELVARVERIAAIFDETRPSGVSPSIELFCNGQRFLYVSVDMNESTGTLGKTQWDVSEGQGTIERIYGVRFKQIE